MWNNMKSDLYRILHTKSFYVILFIIVLFSCLVFTGSGFVCNTPFAQYHIGKNTFSEFLYYLPKSLGIQSGVLIFISMFLCDEYSSGFVKNTYPMQTQKWKIVLSRYVLYFLISMIFIVVNVVVCSIVQLFYQAEGGSLQVLDYVLFLIMQGLFLSTFASLLAMLQYLINNRVILILLSFAFGTMLLYVMVLGLGQFLAPNLHVTEYMLYEVSGLLPNTISWDGYQKGIFVIIVYSLLYNSISYLLLKKKDIN